MRKICKEKGKKWFEKLNLIILINSKSKGVENWIKIDKQRKK